MKLCMLSEIACSYGRKIAMYLSKKEIVEFKKKLLEIRKEHQKAFDDTSSEVKTPEEARGSSQHHADEGSDDFERTINIEMSSEELQVLKYIDRALEKIEEGTYGLCDVTGDKIPRKRLEATPYAIMTIESQERMEKGLL